MFLKFVSGVFLLVIIAMVVLAGNLVRERNASFEKESHVPNTAGMNSASITAEEISEIDKQIPSTEAPSPKLSIAAKKLLPPSLSSPLVYGGDGTNGELSGAGVFNFTNKNRAKENLPSLARNSLLDAAAILKMNDMFKRGYFKHISPDGKGIVDLAKSVGYQFVSVGENLALGNFGGDEALVDAWMASPGHRENIMKPNFQEIGIAVGQGMFNGKKTWIAVQEFGRPVSACPDLDESLPAQITSNNEQIAKWKKEARARREELEGMSEYNPLYYEKAREYNELAERINALIEKNSTLVTQYNAQVWTYNKCVEE